MSAAIEVVMGWRDRDIAADRRMPVTDLVFRTDALIRARKHLAVEMGGLRARSIAAALRRHLSRLARHAATQGLYLEVHVTNQTDGPVSVWADGTMAVLVRAIDAGRARIRWSVIVTARAWEPYTLPRWPGQNLALGRHRTPIALVVSRATTAWDRHVGGAPAMAQVA